MPFCHAELRASKPNSVRYPKQINTLGDHIRAHRLDHKLLQKQVAAADKAIKADPTFAIAYYLKGNGLIPRATVDKKTNKLIPAPGCREAFQKYLELAPTGQFADSAKGMLASMDAKVDTAYKNPNAPAPKKKK